MAAVLAAPWPLLKLEVSKSEIQGHNSDNSIFFIVDIRKVLDMKKPRYLKLWDLNPKIAVLILFTQPFSPGLPNEKPFSAE